MRLDGGFLLFVVAVCCLLLCFLSRHHIIDRVIITTIDETRQVWMDASFIGRSVNLGKGRSKKSQQQEPKINWIYNFEIDTVFF